MIIFNTVRTLQKLFWCVQLILLFTFCNGYTIAQPSAKKSYHILFVGNSYTYINSLPQMFKAIVKYQFPNYPVKVKFIGGGGATLKKHWQVGEALNEIKSGYWNYVVLQGQSMLGSSNLTDPDSPKQFYKYARKFDAEIKTSGAKTVFFMTWSRKYLPEQQKYLTKAYKNIAKELGSLLAPVGIVWEILRKNSGINLYRSDGSHPTRTGSYLAALTLFETIFHIVPRNIPGRLYGHRILRGGKLSPQKTCLCNLSKEKVVLLKQAVNDVLSK